MKTCSRSAHRMLQKLICFALLPVIEAQKVDVLPEVTGYLQNDVTLSCQFIQGPKDSNITQFQWDLLQPEGEDITLAVSNSQHGVHIPESPLKGRVEIAEQSLIIKKMEMTDAGSYTCRIFTFPSGSFEGTTKLVVGEHKPLSTEVISAVVTSVLLLLVIVAAVVYFIFIRRQRDSSGRHRVFIDTAGPGIDVARPSVIVREEDVVYSDIKLSPSRSATPSSKYKHRDTVNADVVYSEVAVLRRQPTEKMFMYCRRADEVLSCAC
ncbi:uncharacterized protein LOC111570341 [Amphiprion ocellaris]|uniref:uncharacterized protein LOC111570341 n=1 Tax=Amphiprion ocellaris TaxID=80972 RepID=UPI000C30C77A|nr:uncharacterized protein LOC111570341 [Amphiprion ocellaris]